MKSIISPNGLEDIIKSVIREKRIKGNKFQSNDTSLRDDDKYDSLSTSIANAGTSTNPIPASSQKDKSQLLISRIQLEHDLSRGEKRYLQQQQKQQLFLATVYSGDDCLLKTSFTFEYANNLTFQDILNNLSTVWNIHAKELRNMKLYCNMATNPGQWIPMECDPATIAIPYLIKLSEDPERGYGRNGKKPKQTQPWMKSVSDGLSRQQQLAQQAQQHVTVMLPPLYLVHNHQERRLLLDNDPDLEETNLGDEDDAWASRLQDIFISKTWENKSFKHINLSEFREITGELFNKEFNAYDINRVFNTYSKKNKYPATLSASLMTDLIIQDELAADGDPGNYPQGLMLQDKSLNYLDLESCKRAIKRLLIEEKANDFLGSFHAERVFQWFLDPFNVKFSLTLKSKGEKSTLGHMLQSIASFSMRKSTTSKSSALSSRTKSNVFSRPKKLSFAQFRYALLLAIPLLPRDMPKTYWLEVFEEDGAKKENAKITVETFIKRWRKLSSIKFVDDKYSFDVGVMIDRAVQNWVKTRAEMADKFYKRSRRGSITAANASDDITSFTLGQKARQVFFILLCFIFQSCALFLTFPVEDSNALIYALREIVAHYPFSTRVLYRDYEFVKNNNQFWRWVVGPLNQFVSDSASVKDGNPNRIISLYYNQYVPISLTMRQLRVDVINGSLPCTTNFNIEPNPNSYTSKYGCLPFYDKDHMSTQKFGPTNPPTKLGGFNGWTWSNDSNVPEIIGEYGTYDSSGFTIDFTNELVAGNKDIFAARANYYRTANWVNNQTRAVIVNFALYNPNTNSHIYAYLLCEFIPAGWIAPTSEFLNFVQSVPTESIIFQSLSLVVTFVLVVQYYVHSFTRTRGMEIENIDDERSQSGSGSLNLSLTSRLREAAGDFITSLNGLFSLASFITSAITLALLVNWNNSPNRSITANDILNQNTSSILSIYGGIDGVMASQTLILIFLGFLCLNWFSLNPHSYYTVTRTLERSKARLLALIVCYWIFVFSFSVFLAQVFGLNATVLAETFQLWKGTIGVPALDQAMLESAPLAYIVCFAIALGYCAYLIPLISIAIIHREMQLCMYAYRRKLSNDHLRFWATRDVIRAMFCCSVKETKNTESGKGEPV